MPSQHLVLLPGLLCTGALFGPQIAALEPICDILVADHTRAPSLAAIAAGILAEAPPTFALAGLSMGGYIAFEMLRQQPQRIEKLALIATNARADRPEQADQRRDLVRLGREQGVANVARMLLPHLVHRSRLTDSALVSLIEQMALDTGIEAFTRQQEAIIGRPDNRPFLGDIECPTTIIVGAEDAITPVKVAKEISDGIRGSRLDVITDCGHLASLEQPEAVNRMLSDWLGG